MKKTIVYYYSNTGNNKYLAEQIGKSLCCEVEEIHPHIGVFPLLITLSAFKIGSGIKSLNHNIPDYDQVILCGPHWMGQICSPVRDFIKKYNKDFKKVVYATCCGSGDENKDDKFGYEEVFNEVRKLLGDNLLFCEALSILLTLPKEKRKDDDLIMKARLNESTFCCDFIERFESFINRVKSS